MCSVVLNSTTTYISYIQVYRNIVYCIGNVSLYFFNIEIEQR